MEDRVQRQFEKTFENYEDSIFRYLLLKTRNRQTAIDLTQDTFIQTWNHLAKGRSIDNIRAFVYRVAHNLWCKSLRVSGRQTSLDVLLDEGWQPADDSNIEAAASSLEDQKEVLRNLETLDETYKTVLTLRFIDELSVQEIADVLGESENTISVRIHRARKKLQEFYTEYGT